MFLGVKKFLKLNRNFKHELSPTKPLLRSTQSLILCCKVQISYVKTDRKWMSLYKWPLYNIFWLFFCHMHVRLSQNWGSDGHFEVLNRSYLWLVQNLWPKTKIFSFLFFFAFLYKNRDFHLSSFLCFCILCHNFCTN